MSESIKINKAGRISNTGLKDQTYLASATSDSRLAAANRGIALAW